MVIQIPYVHICLLIDAVKIKPVFFEIFSYLIKGTGDRLVRELFGVVKHYP